MLHRNTVSSLSFSGLRLRDREFRGLSGWRGKPLHPPLASVPMGTTVAAVAFDVASGLSLGSAGLDRELYRSAGFVLLIGQAFVALAILTGWWERRRLTRRASEVRRAVNAHAWLMLGFGAVSFFNLILRRNVYPDAARSPALVIVTTILLGLLAVLGGTLGGTLTFEDGLAVETNGHDS